MMCGFAQMVPPDRDPSSYRIHVFTKNTNVIVITWSPFRSILDYFLFSLSFLDVCASIRLSRCRCVFFVTNLVLTSASYFCVSTWWMVTYPSLIPASKEAQSDVFRARAVGVVSCNVVLSPKSGTLTTFQVPARPSCWIGTPLPCSRVPLR